MLYNVIYIFKKIGQLSRTATQDSGVLTVGQATSADSGMYQCVGKDSLTQEDVTYETSVVSVDEYQAIPTAKMVPERWLHLISFAHQYNNNSLSYI